MRQIIKVLLAVLTVALIFSFGINKSISQVTDIDGNETIGTQVCMAESREEGYPYSFTAANPGKTAITLSIQNMKKEEDGVIKKLYKTKVFNDSNITKVNVLDIYNNPELYTDKLYILDGISRGWGKPVNASIVWGTQVTRSDWVFEDNTGALFITGIFMIESGKEVKIIGNVVLNENNEWTFYGYRSIPE